MSILIAGQPVIRVGQTWRNHQTGAVVIVTRLGYGRAIVRGRRSSFTISTDSLTTRYELIGEAA